MTVSQITRSLDEPINLPNVGPDGEPLETVSVTINMDVDGKMMVAGLPFDMNSLVTAVQKEMSRAGGPNQMKILIRCDRDCPGEFVNQLGNRLAELGISQVRVSVQGNHRE